MSKILRLLDLSFEAWATLDHTFHERLAGDLYEAIEDVRNENNKSQMEAFDEALEWAASWITGAQLLGRSEEIQEYARNMAMSIRAAKRGLVYPECAGSGKTGSIGLPRECTYCDGTGIRR